MIGELSVGKEVRLSIDDAAGLVSQLITKDGAGLHFQINGRQLTGDEELASLFGKAGELPLGAGVHEIGGVDCQGLRGVKLEVVGAFEFEHAESVARLLQRKTELFQSVPAAARDRVPLDIPVSLVGNPRRDGGVRRI